LNALSIKYYSSTTLTSLSSGGHNVTVYASDAVGNMNSSTVCFTVMQDLMEGFIDCLLPPICEIGLGAPVFI